MNPEIKDRWLEKLESGEYDQTSGELRNDEGYCCLGVLCEVAVEDGVIERGEEVGYLTAYAGYYSSKSDVPFIENSTLPKEVVEWAGLEDRNPTVPFSAGCDGDCDDYECMTDLELSELNDGEHLNFVEIATYIRENL